MMARRKNSGVGNCYVGLVYRPHQSDHRYLSSLCKHFVLTQLTICMQKYAGHGDRRILKYYCVKVMVLLNRDRIEHVYFLSSTTFIPTTLMELLNECDKPKFSINSENRVVIRVGCLHSIMKTLNACMK